MSGRSPLSGRVESTGAPDLLRAGTASGSANETVPVKKGAGRPGRITSRQVERVRTTLRTSDWTVLNHVNTAKVLSGQQLRSLVEADTQSDQRGLRRQLRELEDKRVIARLGRRIGGVRAGSDSYVWSLDVIGQRLLAKQAQRRWRRPWTPTERILRHALAVSDLYVTLLLAERLGQIEVLSFRAEPQSWRDFIGPGGARFTLKPDAHVVIARGDLEVHAWIEIDMATESLPWITEKARAYGRYYDTGTEQAETDVFPRCLWLTPTRDRALNIVDALSHLPADEWKLHQVATQDHAVAALLAGSDGNARGHA